MAGIHSIIICFAERVLFVYYLVHLTIHFNVETHSDRGCRCIIADSAIVLAQQTCVNGQKLGYAGIND